MKKLKPIRSLKDINQGLKSLKQMDKQLAKIIELAGEVPLRIRPASFESLCHIVISQQLSVASADSIWARLIDIVNPFDVETLAGISDDQIKEAGVSRPKIKTLRAIASAVEDGLDLNALTNMSADKAHTKLCEIWGVGGWTADIFLLFCSGHPDIFPSGDVALQHAVTQGLELAERPSVEELDRIAEAWKPWRGVAARLFWAYYRTIKQGRETLPI